MKKNFICNFTLLFETELISNLNIRLKNTLRKYYEYFTIR